MSAVDKWLAKVEIDAGKRPGLSSEERRRALPPPVGEQGPAGHLELLEVSESFLCQDDPVKIDPFIEAEEAAGHSVKHSCDLFKVSRVAYYERRSGVQVARNVTDAELFEKITAISKESKDTYGSPQIQLELVQQKMSCGQHWLKGSWARLAYKGRCKKHSQKTTVVDPQAERGKDLIKWHFRPCEELNRRYVGDITYIMAWEG